MALRGNSTSINAVRNAASPHSTLAAISSTACHRKASMFTSARTNTCANTKDRISPLSRVRTTRSMRDPSSAPTVNSCVAPWFVRILSGASIASSSFSRMISNVHRSPPDASNKIRTHSILAQRSKVSAIDLPCHIRLAEVIYNLRQ